MATTFLTLLVLMVIALGTGVWIWLALASVGAAALALFRSLPVDKILAQNIWNTVTTPELLALPLFVLMAEVLFHSKLSENLFRGIAPWTTRLPGRLIHVNVIACTVFAAVSGSSAATAATIGRMTVGELLRRGYDRRLVVGSLAGAGTLGFLIPPSTAMIIYALLANVSVIELFAAGVFPGLVLAGLFMLYLVGRAIVSPELFPVETYAPSWPERFTGLLHLGPVLSLILAVLGSMYSGIATPTEAAAMGVLGALIIVGIQSGLTFALLRTSLVSTVRTSSMIGLIVAAASFLSVALGYLGIPQWVASQFASWHLGPYELIVLLILVYAILGCFLDGVSMTVMTLPITLPLVLAAGFDAIWFGVFIVVCVEMAQVTPPVGFNLFVLQGLTGDSLGSVSRAAFPFFLILLAMHGVLALFPELVMLGPRLLRH